MIELLIRLIDLDEILFFYINIFTTTFLFFFFEYKRKGNMNKGQYFPLMSRISYSSRFLSWIWEEKGVSKDSDSPLSTSPYFSSKFE